MIISFGTYPQYQLLTIALKLLCFFTAVFFGQGNDQYMEKSSSDFMSGGLSVGTVYGCDDNHV